MELLLELFQGMNSFLENTTITLFSQYVFTLSEVVRFSVGVSFALLCIYILFHITEW